MSLPASHPLSCSGCAEALPVPEDNREQWAECPGCSRTLMVSVFPKLTEHLVESGKLSDRMDGESACFFDPEKPAEQVCDECGCLMNSLYDMPVGDRHYCIRCVERMRKENSPLLISNKTRYDLLAFYMTVIGFLVFYFSIITAPLALMISVIQFKKPQSLVQHSRIYFITAIFFSLIQIAGWIAFFGFLFYVGFGGES